MIEKGIVVYWDEAQEFVPVNLQIGPGQDRQEVASTYEWWPKAKRGVSYNTTCKWKPIPGSGVQLEIQYERSRNQQIDRELQEDIPWGTSIITIERGATKGQAVWLYEGKKPSHQCQWEAVTANMRKRSPIFRLERPKQQALRAFLLSIDKFCAISREMTPGVLEAAHILPVSEHGEENIDNAILLRADLHRLYDARRDGEARAFEIDKNGRVRNVSSDLSKAYRELLKGASLPKATFDRVRLALERCARSKT